MIHPHDTSSGCIFHVIFASDFLMCFVINTLQIYIAILAIPLQKRGAKQGTEYLKSDFDNKVARLESQFSPLSCVMMICCCC